MTTEDHTYKSRLLRTLAGFRFVCVCVRAHECMRVDMRACVCVSVCLSVCLSDCKHED